MVTHKIAPKSALARSLSALVAATIIAVLMALASPAAAFINVTDYGAKGDGSDATAAINAAIAAAGPGGDTIYLPAGSYAISSTIVISGKHGLRIVGDGVGATQLMPNGLGGEPVLQFVNDMFNTVENLTINGNSQSPPSAGIESDAAPNGESTHLTVRDVRIGSANSDSVVDGIRFAPLQGADAMNDQGFFENVTIANFSHAAYSFLGHNSLVHTIVGGSINYGPIGIYTEGGTFKISGTHFQSLSDVIFDFENPAAGFGYEHAIMIDGISTESASNLLRTGSTPVNVGVSSCDVKGAPTSGPYIDWNSSGMLSINNSYMYSIQGSDYFQFNAGTVNFNSDYVNGNDMIFLNSTRLNSEASCWIGGGGGAPAIQANAQSTIIDNGDSCNPLVASAPVPNLAPPAAPAPSKFCRNHKHSPKCR